MIRVDLKGLTALVTGSTRGIGYEAARQLSTSGAHVVVNGRNDEEVTAAVRSLAGGALVSGVAADIATPEGVAKIKSAIPKVDILVCNAAVFDWTSFFDTTDAHWQEHFQINVMSGVRLAQAYMQDMLARNWGRIVMVASEAGLNIPPDMVHYGVSKAAEIALARGLAELTTGTGVTVNSVLPGPTLSSNASEYLDNYAKEKGISRSEANSHAAKSLRPTNLIGRFASVEEVASMILYACSREASATNGAALRVEGGILRHPG